MGGKRDPEARLAVLAVMRRAGNDEALRENGDHHKVRVLGLSAKARREAA